MIVLLWLLLFAAGYLIFSNLGCIIQALGNVIAAVISALAVLVGAILTHALTAIRDQRNKQLSEKQKNYSRLINNINEIVWNPQVTSDNFSMIHLESWIVGSSEVVKLTQSLLEAKTRGERRAAIKALLTQMRSEVGLSKLDASINLNDVFKTKEGL